MSATKPRTLIVTNRSPAQGVLAREVLDAALACATFDVPTDVLFCGDAVWQLVAGQGSSPITGKAISDAWRAAPLYDIQGLHADETALTECGLAAVDLIPEVQLASPARIRELLARCDKVLSL